MTTRQYPPGHVMNEPPPTMRGRGGSGHAGRNRRAGFSPRRELPAEAGAYLKSPRLRDPEGAVSVAPEVLDRARQYAQAQVDELRRLVFPLHGL